MVDAADSKSVAGNGVLVRVRPGAPINSMSFGILERRSVDAADFKSLFFQPWPHRFPKIINVLATIFCKAPCSESSRHIRDTVSFPVAPGNQCSLDRIQYEVEIFSYILRKKAQDEIAVFLK